MTDKKDGGPAFPNPAYDVIVPTDGEPLMMRHDGQQGMSLRDWFAGQAPPMPYQFEIDSVAENPKEHLSETISAWNYLYADAMIKEGEK